MPVDIDDRFVDVAFDRQPEFVAGCTGPGNLNLFSSFEGDGATPMLTRSQAMAEIEKIQATGGGMERLIVEVKNQKQEGSCVGNASTQGLQVLEAWTYGRSNVTLLSAIATYKQIGSSPGSGANVADALQALQRTGTLPLDTPENRAKFGAHVMPATGFYTKFPDGWKETAKKFRIAEATVIRSMEGLRTALLSGIPVVVGRESHSILYLGIIIKNGKLYFLYVNSWGQWGMAAGHMAYGFGLDTEGQASKSAQWAFGIRSIVDR